MHVCEVNKAALTVKLQLFCCITFFPVCSCLTPCRGKSLEWWCITAAVWLWTSIASFYFTGSSMRGTTSPPSGQRELQPSMGRTTPWSCNSTPPTPLLICLWGLTFYSVYCMLTHITSMQIRGNAQLLGLVHTPVATPLSCLWLHLD